MEGMISKIWNKGFGLVKYRFQDVVFSMGMGKHLLRNRPGGRILVYHGVTPKGNIGLNFRFLSVDLFERQLIYFKDHFHLISLEEYCAGERHPEKLTLALTFDDGYANNFKYVLPLLEKHEVPATFFVTGIRDIGRDILWPDALDLSTAFSDDPIVVGDQTFKKVRGEYRLAQSGVRLKFLAKDKDHEYHRSIEAAFPLKAAFREQEDLKDYWQQMTIEELQQMDKSPWASIGLHGYLHTCLALILKENAEEELRVGKKFLERILDRQVDFLAYPDGSYSMDLVRFSRELGFKQQMAVQFNETSDKKAKDLWERFGMHPNLSFNNQVACLLKGKY